MRTATGRQRPRLAAELFTADEQRLGRFLVQLVGDRTLAEDLLQEVFLTALRRQAALADADDQSAWLFGVARNHALAALRARRRATRALARLTGFAAGAVREDPPDVEAVRDVLRRSLGHDDQALLLLRYVHGFDAPALARMTGRSPEAVRARLSRAVRRLRAAV